ncbi:hypothetical protein CEXT_188471 [Caerostris extrusa]|uniref:Uncharacterized protein n=1 Tax=Caerostris extrusa TaxID=172846 RepID=A0AAV4U9Y6_CAEEX|nr:hypothetical protein CEXT_188471 [Caerostris extrusa]
MPVNEDCTYASVREKRYSSSSITPNAPAALDTQFCHPNFQQTSFPFPPKKEKNNFGSSHLSPYTQRKDLTAYKIYRTRSQTLHKPITALKVEFFTIRIGEIFLFSNFPPVCFCFLPSLMNPPWRCAVGVEPREASNPAETICGREKASAAQGRYPDPASVRGLIIYVSEVLLP